MTPTERGKLNMALRAAECEGYLSFIIVCVDSLLEARTKAILTHLKMLPDITYYGKPSSKQKVIQYIKAQFLTTKPNE